MILNDINKIVACYLLHVTLNFEMTNKVGHTIQRHHKPNNPQNSIFEFARKQVVH